MSENNVVRVSSDVKRRRIAGGGAGEGASVPFFLGRLVSTMGLVWKKFTAAARAGVSLEPKFLAAWRSMAATRVLSIDDPTVPTQRSAWGARDAVSMRRVLVPVGLAPLTHAIGICRANSRFGADRLTTPTDRPLAVCCLLKSRPSGPPTIGGAPRTKTARSSAPHPRARVITSPGVRTPRDAGEFVRLSA